MAHQVTKVELKSITTDNGEPSVMISGTTPMQCQILGLGETGSALSNAAFGQGSGDIILDNVQCVGTETDLFSCPSNGPLSHNCGHGEDAGVQCSSTPSGECCHLKA